MKNKLVLTILTVLILAGCASKPETEEEKEPAEVILYQLAQDRINAKNYSGAVESLARIERFYPCLLYTSPSPRDKRQSRMPSSA